MVNAMWTTTIQPALDKLPPLYSYEEDEVPDNEKPCVFLFLPGTAATWLVWEYDPESGRAFGWAEVIPGMGELGYIYMPEIEEAKHPVLRIGVEMDAVYQTVASAVAHLADAGVEVKTYNQANKN